MTSLESVLVDQGIIQPLTQAGSEVRLTWDVSATEAVFGDEVLVALPDMHLGAGSAGDVFAWTQRDAMLARLLRFVKALRDARGTGVSFRVVQLGDLYDVWRAYPEFRDHPTSDYRRIEDAYGSSLGILLQDLGAQVCIGNHDAVLGLYPPAWARSPNGVTGQLAYGHRFADSRVLALHGHQETKLAQVMAAQGGDWAVRLATEVAKLSNSLSFAIQNGFDFLEDFFSDGPASLTDFLNGRWPDVDPPADSHGFRSDRWCDRGGRDVIERIVGALPGASDLRLVIIGHSHRPGISAIHVNQRLVPLVDVGSWVMGRAQVAICTEGDLRLWNIV